MLIKMKLTTEREHRYGSNTMHNHLEKGKVLQTIICYHAACVCCWIACKSEPSTQQMILSWENAICMEKPG